MAQTQSASYFTGLRDDFTDLGISYLRGRFVDSQTTDDESNVPDQADMYYNESAQPAYQPAPGGVSLTAWLTAGLALVAGAIILKKVL